MSSTIKTVRQVSAADEYIGLQLRKARYKMGLSQKEIAQKINISPQQYYKYEQGINRILLNLWVVKQ